MFRFLLQLFLALFVAAAPHCDGYVGATNWYSTCQNNALVAYQNAINQYQTQYQNTAAVYAGQTSWPPDLALGYISLNQNYAYQMQQLMATANTNLQSQLAACTP